jgi:hypothetical protein
MDFSSVFKKDMAGKYSGLPGFSAGISLSENLTTPLSQQSSGMGMSSGSSFEDTLAEIIRRQSDPAYRKEVMADKLAYDKEQMKQAFPYLMAREIPRQISEGFGNQAMLNVLGARNTVDAMNQTLQAYPRMSFQTSGFNPQRYLS